MLGYIAKRLGLTALVIWGAMSIMFVMFVAIPGSAVNRVLGDRALSPVIKKNLERQYGLDKPLPQQYVNYWVKLAHWDLGEGTVDSNQDLSVNEVLKSRAGNSARLAIWGLAVEIILGVGIGLIAAVRRYSKLDIVTGFVSIALTGVPVFVMGLISQQIFALKFKDWGFPAWARLPVGGIPEKWWFFIIPHGPTWKRIILPSIIIALVNVGYIARLARSSLLDVLKAEYMRTAAAKGLSKRRTILKHGLRNALIPVVTQLGIDVITLFGVAVLTETVFNWPGLGSSIAEAAQVEDVAVVLGLSFPVIAVAALAALVVDLLYGVLDPRVRVADGGQA
jgi:oligopeptide transport system permease protein